MVVLACRAPLLAVCALAAGLMCSSAYAQSSRRASPAGAYAAAPSTNDSEGASSDRLDLGLGHGKNFTVTAPRGDRLAQRVADRAEELRREIALTWLGEELPDGKGRTHITLELATNKDEGLTWLCGGGREVRGDHRMFLATSPQRATGSTLAHEVTHVVLSVRFPQGMPAWANEGIASLADDAERHETRRQLTRQWARQGGWPSLEKLLAQRTLPPSDEAGYAASVSLVNFLLIKGDRRGLIEFVAQSPEAGWDGALRKCYGIPRVDDLQRQWQAWVTHDGR